MANQIQSCFERYEKKYMLTPAQLRVMLTGMKAHMVPDQYGKYTICNIYYDTPDWRLIRASLEKPVYKEKLRVRSYGVAAPDGKVFVEIKKKFDGVVYKRRITAPAPLVSPLLTGQLEPDRFGQIGREIGWFQSFYHTQPKVFIGYDRTAFAGREDPELRITFDTGLHWRDTALALLTAVNFGQRSESERVLKITIPESLDYDGLFDDLFDQYTRSHTLERVKTANMGTLYELEYRVTLPGEQPSKEFLDALRCRNGNLNIVCGRPATREAL